MIDIKLRQHHSHRWSNIDRFSRVEISRPDTPLSRNMALGIDDFLIVAAVTMLLASGVSAYASYSAGQAQKRMSAYNALVAERNADLAGKKRELQQAQIRIQEQKERKKTQRFLASQKTGYAKAGVLFEGTPMAVMEDTVMEGELDAQAIRYAGSLEEANIIAEQSAYRQEAVLQSMRGQAASQAGAIGAGKELITGIGQFANYSAEAKLYGG